MNNINPLVHKIIETRNLNEQELHLMLDEWDETGRIDWLHSTDETHSLLSKWIRRSIPIPIFERLIEKHGKELFLTPHQTDTTKTCIEYLLTAVVFTQNTPYYDEIFSSIVKNYGEDDVAQWILPAIKLHQDNLYLKIQQTPSIFQLTYAAIYLNCYDTSKMLLERNPQLISQTDGELSIPFEMTRNRNLFNTYIKLGGSLFQDINGTPLWKHLFNKKITHASYTDYLHSLHQQITRQTDTVFIEGEEKEKYLDAKSEIEYELGNLKFEKNLESDWKNAVKQTKGWRNWTNSSGNNAMHYIAQKSSKDFLAMCLQPINQRLIGVKDTQGNDSLMHMYLGFPASIPDHTIALRNFKDDFAINLNKILPFVDTNPTNGLLVSLLTSHPLTKHQRPLSNKLVGQFIKELSVLTKNTNFFWNGLTTEHLIECLVTKTTFNKIERDFFYLLTHVDQKWDQTPIFQDINNKIVITGLMCNAQFLYDIGSEQRDRFKSMVEDICSFDETHFNLPQNVLSAISQSKVSSYTVDIQAALNAMSTWAEKMYLKRSILETSPNIFNEQNTRKRKM